MSTRLILVCHAPTSATRSAAFPLDEPVDAHGLAAAVAAAGALRRVDTALRGPGRRCTETAAALGLDAVLQPALADGDVGRWAGRTLDDVMAEEPAAVASWLNDPTAAPHGGESLIDLLDRTNSWLASLPEEAGTVVAVTHPMVIRAVVVNAIAATPASFWRIDVSPLTRTVLRGGAGRWTLRETGNRLTPPTTAQ